MPNKQLFDQVLEYIGQGKKVTIRIKGNSMLPFLREGDKVLLKAFEIKELTRGIIVLAKTSGKIVLHRVVKYDDFSIWLAGDHNLVAREQVSYADVIATVVSLSRGEVAVKVNQRWGRTLGQAWYLIRPCRRVVSKLFNKCYHN